MTDSFLENICIAFYQKKVSKTEILKPVVASINEIYQQGFLLKITVWNRFAKVAITKS